MTFEYSIPPELLGKFKEPFGILIRGNPKQTMKALQEIVEREKPPRIVSVGDMVSQNLYEFGFNPQLMITDSKCMRAEIELQVLAKKIVRVKNPQGVITNAAITAIREALEDSSPVQIIVDGEEDMLTLIAVLYAPENTIVVYGQPHEGIVAVKVTLDKRSEASDILKAMKYFVDG